MSQAPSSSAAVSENKVSENKVIENEVRSGAKHLRLEHELNLLPVSETEVRAVRAC